MLYCWEIMLRETAISGILGVAALSISVDALSRWLRRPLRIEMLPARRSSQDTIAK
jgi:hypothetical protein